MRRRLRSVHWSFVSFSAYSDLIPNHVLHVRQGVAQDANTEVSKVQDGGKAVTDVKASKKQVETVEKATVAKDSSAGAKPGSEPEESSTSMTLSKPETIVVGVVCSVE